jgi:hypothetical protein
MSSETDVNTGRMETLIVKKTGSAHRLRLSILSPFLCSVLATTGLFGGISALFIGLVCVIIHALVNGDKAFNSVGTVLLISAIPMILVGSIFLDEIEKSN